MEKVNEMINQICFISNIKDGTSYFYCNHNSYNILILVKPSKEKTRRRKAKKTRRRKNEKIRRRKKKVRK